VAVIGGGFSGIAAAIKAKQQGIIDLTLFEQSPRIGGTWWDSQYPGAEVDTPSILYSFSFAPRRWSRTHVARAELLDYLEDVATEYGLRSHLRLGHAVESVEWHEDRHGYQITTDDGTVSFANVVVSAIGFLNQPRYPDWPGLKSFRGPVLHTSRWNPELELEGKRVAVVGTGSTAVQLVPAIADIAKEVLVFQREPGWILPKAVRPFAPHESAALGSPLAQRIARTLMLARREKAQYRNSAWRPGTKANAASERAARSYIKKVFADRPDLAELVTPAYSFGGKRPVLNDDFYPALLRDDVRLVPRAVTKVSETGVVDSTGTEYDADILVLSTGFRTDFMPNFKVTGRNGRTLADIWQGEPQALLGLLIENLPNFFMMYGPNTNGGSIITNIEAQATYVAAALRHLSRGAASIEVRPSALWIFNRILQRRLAGASFETANNYYKSASGRIISQWSDGAMAYALATKLWRRPAWRVRRLPDQNPGPIASLEQGLRGARVLNDVDTGSVWAGEAAKEDF
jgi:cation diffusion facilitator CzcD-associated flavoprotein CzcO